MLPLKISESEYGQENYCLTKLGNLQEIQKGWNNALWSKMHKEIS